MTWVGCGAAAPTEWNGCGVFSLVRTSGSGLIYRSDDGSGSAADFDLSGSGGAITGGAGTAASPWRHTGVKDAFQYINLKSSIFNGTTGFLQARISEVLTGGIGNAGHDHFVAIGLGVVNGTTFVLTSRDWYRADSLPTRFAILEAFSGGASAYIETAASEESGGGEVNLGLSFDTATKAYRAYLGEDDATLTLPGVDIASSGVASVRMNYGTAGDPYGLSDIANVMLAVGDSITVSGLESGLKVRLRNAAGDTLAEEISTGASAVLDCLGVKMDEVYDLAIMSAGGIYLVGTEGAEVWPGETWVATIDGAEAGASAWTDCGAGSATGWSDCG